MKHKTSDKAVSKYLSTYCEKTSRQLFNDLHASSFLPSPTKWQHIVVIPSHSEDQQIQAQLDSLSHAAKCAGSQILVIYVINEVKSAPPHTSLSNAACRKTIQSQFQHSRHVASDSAFVDCHRRHLQYNGLDFLTVNFTKEHAFNDDQGVGLARRIGADLAFLLWVEGYLKSSFFYSTDADTLLPSDYFDIPQTDATTSAYTFPFRHVAGTIARASEEFRDKCTSKKVKQDQVQSEKLDATKPANHELIAHYELNALHLYDSFLRYYQQGLHRAGSPYAFFTIGSVLAVDLTRYAQVRGFPKRLAGEDFYLLNKLAKLAPIKEINTQPILIGYRPSQRVPFGTGPAVQSIAARLAAGEPYLVYHPLSFDILKHVIEGFALLASTRDGEVFFEHLRASNASLAFGKVSGEVWGELLHQLVSYFKSPYFTGMFHRALQRGCAADREKLLHESFDAFRTLKFMHFLRNFLPSVPFNPNLLHRR